MKPLKRATRAGRRSAAEQVLEHLRAADRFPAGDARREAAQRKAARAVAAEPSVVDHPVLAGVRSQLRRWARFAPYLMTDRDESTLAASNRMLVAEQLSILGSLDREAATALDAADDALHDLDAADPACRLAADEVAHQFTARRAPTTAAVLGHLASCHLADDGQRGIEDWRTRFAFVQGTTPATIAALRAATHEAGTLATKWWQVRSEVVGARYCDRRVGLPASPASLAEHASAAAAGVAYASPRLASAAGAAASRIRPGSDNQVVVEADGRISATVFHRPTPRGSLMVAHEIGHTLHALESRSPEPPGALVGETIACWSSLVTGQFHTAHGGQAVRPLVLALGDTLVEELFISEAVSVFEDAVYQLAGAGVVTPGALNAAWLAAHRHLLGDAMHVPDHTGSGWARLPSLATDPGHAVSYVWATVLALAILGRHSGDSAGVVANAIAAGGVDADEFTALLGFDGDEWIAAGLGVLGTELDRLGQLVRSGGTSAGAA